MPKEVVNTSIDLITYACAGAVGMKCPMLLGLKGMYRAGWSENLRS